MVKINKYELENVKYYYYEDQLSFSDFFKEKLNINFKMFISFLDLANNESYILFEDDLASIQVVNGNITIPSFILVLKDVVVYSTGTTIKLPNDFVKGILYVKNDSLNNSSKVNINNVNIYLKYTNDINESVGFSSQDIQLIEIDSSLNVVQKYTKIENAIGTLTSIPPHTHPINDVVNLQTTLDNKSDVGHIHTITDVSNLQTTLDNKSNVGHTHTILEITNLQTVLDNKSDVSHNHTFSSLNEVQGSFTGHKGKVLRVNILENQVEYYELLEILLQLSYNRYVISNSYPTNPTEFMQFYHLVEDKIYVYYESKWIHIPFSKIVGFYPEFYAGYLRIINGYFEIAVGDFSSWVKCYPVIGKNVELSTTTTNYFFILQPGQRMMFNFTGNRLPIVFNPNLNPSFRINLSTYDTSASISSVGLRLSEVSNTYNLTQFFISNGTTTSINRLINQLNFIFARKVGTASMYSESVFTVRLYNSPFTTGTMAGSLVSQFGFYDTSTNIVGLIHSFFNGFGKSNQYFLGNLINSVGIPLNYLWFSIERLI